LTAKQAIIGASEDDLGLVGMSGQTKNPAIARDPITPMPPRFAAIKTEPDPGPNRAYT
jgi:hypothetical protein